MASARSEALREAVALDGAPEHRVEGLTDLRSEIALDLIDLGEFSEGPTAVRAEVVHTGHPIGGHRGGLLLGILAAVALDLHDEMKKVIVSVAVID